MSQGTPNGAAEPIPAAPASMPQSRTVADLAGDDSSDDAEFSRRVLRWVTRASVAGFAISVIAHIVFLIVSGCLLYTSDAADE